MSLSLMGSRSKKLFPLQSIKILSISLLLGVLIVGCEGPVLEPVGDCSDFSTIFDPDGWYTGTFNNVGPQYRYPSTNLNGDAIYSISPVGRPSFILLSHYGSKVQDTIPIGIGRHAINNSLEITYDADGKVYVYSHLGDSTWQVIDGDDWRYPTWTNIDSILSASKIATQTVYHINSESGLIIDSFRVDTTGLPYYSPDGRKFAYEFGQNENSHIYVYDFDSREKTLLIQGAPNLYGDGGQIYDLAWVGNDSILLSIPGALFISSIHTAETRQLASFCPEDYYGGLAALPDRKFLGTFSDAFIKDDDIAYRDSLREITVSPFSMIDLHP